MKDKSGVIFYLSQFPDGRYINSAKIRLLDFERIELEAERERKKAQQKPQVHIIPSIM